MNQNAFTWSFPYLTHVISFSGHKGISRDQVQVRLCVYSNVAYCEDCKVNLKYYWKVLIIKTLKKTSSYINLIVEFMFLLLISQGTGDEYCHFKIEKNLETGSVSLESVQNKGIYVGLLPDGQTKPVVNTGERNIFFYPQVIKCM